MRYAFVVALLLLLARVAQARTVELTWDPPEGGDPPAGYTMYKKEPGKPMFELVASIAVGTLTWEDTSVGPGESCWYITAWNAWGESAPSNTYCFFLGTAPSPPKTLRLGK